MATEKMQVEAIVPWWIHPWLMTLVFVAVVTGAQPDWERVQAKIARSIKFRIVATGRWL